MKIQNFINQNKNIHLENELKQSIYQVTLQKINKLQKRGYSRFFYTKISLGVFLVFGLGFLLYNNNIYIQQTENIQIIRSQSINTVLADNVATIISFDGKYNIYHGDKISQNINIGDGDIVVLEAGSKIKFDVNSESYGEVYGPARFSIKKDGSNKYFININESEYFKFYKKAKLNDSITNSLLTNRVETTITTTNYKIKGKDLDIIIAKKSKNETIIKNNGDNLTISDGINEIDIPTNKIAKLDKEINIIGNADDENIDEIIKDKINNPDIILLSYEEKTSTFDENIISDLVNKDLSEKHKNKTENGKILDKKFSQSKIILNKINTGINETGTVLKLLSDKDLFYLNSFLNYKSIQSRFDSISIKMSSYDRNYIEEVYTIGDILAQMHTKLNLSVNYYPNIYYIKYMSNNLKSRLLSYDNVPNDYIYSLTYISKMMDELNQKKPGDTLDNNYGIVPEIIKENQKNDSGINYSGETLSGLNLSTGANASGSVKFKDTMLQFKKQMHGSASGDNSSGENL